MIRRTQTRVLVGLLALILSPVVAPEGRAGALETIQDKIAQFLRRPGIRSTEWGIEIVDPTTNAVLVSVNSEKTFKPASVLKVVTTAAALEKLGPDFRYRTGVYTTGAIQPDGVLAGDLILVGRGDPNLTNEGGDLLQRPAIDELAGKLKELGIKKVRGDVVGDDSYFEHTSHGKGWTSRDLRTLYGAPINALSINNNVFWVHARATGPKQRVAVGLEPRTSYFHIRNLGLTASRRAKRTLYARLIPGTRTIVVSGVLPLHAAHSQYVLLEKPAEVAASLLRESLEREGVDVTGGVTTLHRGEIPSEAQKRWKLLAEHLSPPLVRGLEIINKQSQNLHAEMLLRTLGAEFRGAGTDEAGLEVVREWLVQAGIESDKIRLNDGCGLSRDNLLTPRFQTSLLVYLSTRPHFELFLNSLAVSGTDGTLKHRLASEPLRGVIHAKTGTLNGVATLSGYMTTKSGRNLIFSIFANNAHASISRVRRTIDEICALFVNLY